MTKDIKIPAKFSIIMLKQDTNGYQKEYGAHPRENVRPEDASLIRRMYIEDDDITTTNELKQTRLHILCNTSQSNLTRNAVMQSYPASTLIGDFYLSQISGSCL